MILTLTMFRRLKSMLFKSETYMNIGYQQTKKKKKFPIAWNKKNFAFLKGIYKTF